MSEPPLHDSHDDDDEEVLDGLPVLPGESAVPSVPPGVPAVPPASPAPAVSAASPVSPAPVVSVARALPGPLTGPVQTVAAAAGGFVAGAAVLGLAHRRHSRRVALAGARPARRIGRAGRRSKAMGQVVEVVATRSLLVDVHLLGAPSRDR